jgi:acetolactate synthase-1/2/3 large subunit
MGFALPAAIGAAFAKGNQWVVIIGDGCIQLSIQELQTITQYKLPIVVCIINNEQHGMVAQFQEENMDSRYIGTRVGYSNPNFRILAEGFGIRNYLLVENKLQLMTLEEDITKFVSGPALIEFKIEGSAKALPKMKFETD